jgi:hypothetical protein
VIKRRAVTVEEELDVEVRHRALRRALTRIIIPAADDPLHPAIARAAELAGEVARADDRRSESLERRIAWMRTALQERGLLERVERTAQSIERRQKERAPQ